MYSLLAVAKRRLSSEANNVLYIDAGALSSSCTFKAEFFKKLCFRKDREALLTKGERKENMAVYFYTSF